MSKKSNIATALLLVCSLVIGWYVTTHDQPTEELVSAKTFTFEEFCVEHKLECSISGTGSMRTYTAVKPLIQAKGENSEFKLGWGMSRGSSQGNSGSYTTTTTATGFGPMFSFHWDVAETFRNLDLKERQR